MATKRDFNESRYSNYVIQMKRPIRVAGTSRRSPRLSHFASIAEVLVGKKKEKEKEKKEKEKKKEKGN